MGRVSPGTATSISSAIISGTVTGNQGTPNTAANGWPVKITDGTDTALVSAGGALIVDASATTQPVSGTVTANAGTNLNTSALLTSTNFSDAFGTAGTPDTQVLSVQGITSMTPILATVTATDLDIRDLSSSTDSVTVVNAGLTELAAAINASSQMDVNIAASGATVPVSNTGLTELAAAINGSSQMDVNIAASGATVPVSNAGLTALNGAISGTEVQVDLASAIPAGNNNIGDVDVASIAAGDNNIGNVDIVSGTITTVSTVTALGAGTTGPMKAEDVAHATGDQGFPSWGVANEAQTSLAADGDYIGQATDVKGNSLVVGNIAHDTADAGNPVKIGGKAVSAEPTAVTANDRVNALFDLVGKLIVLPYANPENFVSGAITSAMTGTTSTSLIAAPASGLRNYITQITVSNAHATVGTDIVIQDGSGGTTLYTIPAAAVYGGATLSFPTPLRQPTTATAIYCANVTTGASTKVSASGYKGA